MKRIGPRMATIVAYVGRNPGCCILDAVVGTHTTSPVFPRGNKVWSHKHNCWVTPTIESQAVHRCIKAGLITATKKGRVYSLHVVG